MCVCWLQVSLSLPEYHGGKATLSPRNQKRARIEEKSRQQRKTVRSLKSLLALLGEDEEDEDGAADGQEGVGPQQWTGSFGPVFWWQRLEVYDGLASQPAAHSISSFEGTCGNAVCSWNLAGDHQLAFGRFWTLQCSSFAHDMYRKQKDKLKQEAKALLWLKEKKANVLFLLDIERV